MVKILDIFCPNCAGTIVSQFDGMVCLYLAFFIRITHNTDAYFVPGSIAGFHCILRWPGPGNNVFPGVNYAHLSCVPMTKTHQGRPSPLDSRKSIVVTHQIIIVCARLVKNHNMNHRGGTPIGAHHGVHRCFVRSIIIIHTQPAPVYKGFLQK